MDARRAILELNHRPDVALDYSAGEIELPMRWYDYLLGRFRWWRRRRGGHWEYWHKETGRGEEWLKTGYCRRNATGGKPLCEEWPPLPPFCGEGI
jgi:hypothetical protein